MSRRGDNIRKRKDGRWEGRYVAARNSVGRHIIQIHHWLPVAYHFRLVHLKSPAKPLLRSLIYLP